MECEEVKSVTEETLKEEHKSAKTLSMAECLSILSTIATAHVEEYRAREDAILKKTTSPMRMTRKQKETLDRCLTSISAVNALLKHYDAELTRITKGE
jgi:hypothetical protein